MYDLLIKIDWTIMCLLLYSELFSASVIFFFKHKNHSFVQKRLNWTNRCCKMFHILLCYFITIHCNLKIWQWCIYSLAKAFQSSLGWTENTWLTKMRPDDAMMWRLSFRDGTVSTMPVTISMLVLKRASIHLN